MNKYDAAQTMNAGTSTKMSMDYQQTASNQSSVSTGTRNIHDDADSIKETGTVHIHGPDGKHYQVNGTTEMTAGGLKATGMIQEMDANGNVIKQYEGSMTAAGNMSDYKNDYHTNKNGKGEDAFFASEIVNTELKAHNTVDTRDVNKSGSETIDNTVVDKRDVTRRGSETVEGDKFTHDSSTNVVTGVKEDHSNILQTGDKETNYGKTQEYSNAYGSLMAGGHESVHADMYRDFVAMKNGDMSQEQFEAKVMNYAKQVSGDMPSSLSKDMSFGQSSDSQKTSSTHEGYDKQVGGSVGVGAGGNVTGNGANIGLSGGVSTGEGWRDNTQNTQSYSNKKGGSASQDMLAVQIKNEMIGNMEDLYKNGGMTHNGESVGQQLSNELSSFVGGKANKPF